MSQLYKTKPLYCIPKAKEMVNNYYIDISKARENNKLLGFGSTIMPAPIIAGIPDCLFLHTEPYSGLSSTDRALSRDCCEAVETRGFSRDICAFTKMYWGSVFLDRYYFGGKFPRPDFCITGNLCEAGHAKAHRQVAEHFGVPFWAFEFPVGPYGQRMQDRIEYVAAQFHDSIEWLQKTTGRQFDDERFIEACRHYFASQVLWGEVLLLNGAVPAPIEFRSFGNLIPLYMLIPHLEETVTFLRMVKAEIEDRVANQIAGVATERFRLMTDNMMPWPAMEPLRYSQHKYGIAWLGSWVYTVVNCMINYQDDGTLTGAKTPEQRGVPIDSRENAIKALAEWELSSHMQGWYYPDRKEASQIALARHWKADGMVLHYNRGCMVAAINIPHAKRAFEQAGIPVTSFEGSCGDARDVDLAQIVDILEAFVERLEAAKG